MSITDIVFGLRRLKLDGWAGETDSSCFTEHVTVNIYLGASVTPQRIVRKLENQSYQTRPMRVVASLGLALAAFLVNCEGSGRGQRATYGRGQRATYGRGRDNIVRTSHGLVQGCKENVPVSNTRHETVDVFWGIPYAKPPIGDRRFKRPEPADPWSGLFQATTPPNSCVQVLVDTVPLPTPTTPLSEDCLYLNVFKPRCKPGGRKMAILVWFHPGFFTFGSSTVELYNGAKLAASECIVVVTVNYRLGAFGFLAVDERESPGNMGLGDAALALAWVQKNAATFGGDSQRITVSGNSAGAGMASVFLQSPRTRHIVNNAIVQSGVSLTKFFHQSRQSARDAGLEFARRLKCFSDNTTAVVACLRQVSASDLALQHLLLTITLRYLMVTITDGYYLTKDPLTALLTGDFKHCEMLTGTAGSEGTFGLSLALPQEYSLRRPDPPANLTDQEFDKTLSEILLIVFKPEAIPGIVGKVKDLYELAQLRKEVPDPTLRVLNQVIGDLVFTCSSRLQATIIANAGQDVYVFSFNKTRDNTTLPKWVGATHTTEIALLFGTTSADFPEFSHRERQLSANMMHLWANFAKYGNPTPGPRDTPTWPKYSAPEPANILQFTDSAEMRPGLTDSGRCAYWNSQPPQNFN